MKAKATYYLRFVIVLILSIVANCVHADASAATSSVITATDYCGRFIYEDGALDRINLDNGYLSYRDASGNRLASPQYHFFLRDHLGNNRVDISASDASFAHVNHYYPFGLPMYIPGSFNKDTQRWKFGNKEFDRVNGLDLYDYEARAYDPASIRFYRPDDLATKYYPISSYAFCANNPLVNTDQSGQVIDTAWDIANVAMGMASLIENSRQGNVGAAVVDGVGVIIDAAAVAVPFVPGGASTGIKAYHIGKATVKSASDVSKTATYTATKAANSTATSYSTRRAAFRQAKRDAGIPTSKNFNTHKKVDAAKSGKSGRKGIEYKFVDITSPDGEIRDVYMQDHFEGHIFLNGTIDNRPHWNIHQPETSRKYEWEKNHYYYPEK